MKLMQVLAAVTFLILGSQAARATDNGHGPTPGGGNYDCFSCHIHGWGPTAWSECISNPNGSAGGCTVDRGKCKFIYDGCSSLPDDPIIVHGRAL